MNCYWQQDKKLRKLRNAFDNNMSTDLKLSRTQISGGFLRRLLGPLLKTALPLIKNVIKP